MDKLYLESISRFKKIFKKVSSSKVLQPTAMTMASADLSARPSVRVLLLKNVDESGFVFYTHYTSRKGSELEKNPQAALCFFWDPLDIQIRVEGHITKVSPEEADEYWSTRPRISQLGAWASRQSKELKNRKELLDRLAHFRKIYKGKDIPRPETWSGYRLKPIRIEFWKMKPYRLHERVLYFKSGTFWKKIFLFP